MKFLKIVANNFKLCEKNFTVNFVPIANKTKEDKVFELNLVDEELYTFSTMGIIGKNASGKTSTVELIALVYDIFSNFRVNTLANIFDYFNNDVLLDITFYHEGFLYRYLTNLYKDNTLVNENIILFKNQKLYKRLYKKSYSSDLFNYDKYEEMNIDFNLPEDTSIIYMLLKNIEFRGIYYTSNDISYYNYSRIFNLYNMLDKNIKLIKSILKMFDEHIINIEIINENKFKISYVDKTYREVTNKELNEILSSGTNKGFSLFTYVVYSLKTGVDLIIDEIENHFHRTLVENLLNLYKDKFVNKKGASLIFTTHDAELLDLFGRDDNIYVNKYDKKIYLENLHETYKIRPELSKRNKFYENVYKTDVDYNALMNFKKEIM